MVLFPDSCSVPFTKRLTPVAYDGFERAVFYDVSPLYGRILLEQGTRLMHEEVVIVSVNSKQSILTTTTRKGPCTRCHRQHVGPCSLEDLIEDMNTMQCYAEKILPAGPCHHHLRASLYSLMAEIHSVVDYEEPHVLAEKFAVLRNAVTNLKVQCDSHQVSAWKSERRSRSST